jgi:hypothetical protein
VSKEEAPTAKLQIAQVLEQTQPPEEPPRHTQKVSHCQAAKLPPARARLLAKTRAPDKAGGMNDTPPYWVGGQQESPPTGSGGGTRTARPCPETGAGAG